MGQTSIENNIRTWSQSDGKQSRDLEPKLWKTISELGAEVMEDYKY
jgi:hypothetical protein